MCTRRSDANSQVDARFSQLDAEDSATVDHDDDDDAANAIGVDGVGRRRDGCHRAVLKNGTFNVVGCSDERSTPPGRDCRRRFRFQLVDAFATIVDARWRYVALLFVALYVVSWFSFALVWWAIVVGHGDDVDRRNATTRWRPCMTNVRTFADSLFFSIDLQSTLGYGSSEIQEECPYGVLLFMLQSAVGAVIEALAVGFLFAKLTRPKRRSQTILFSRVAVVDVDPDGRRRPLFQFRVVDLRRTARLASATVSAFVVVVGGGGGGVDGDERLTLDRRCLNLTSDTSTDAGDRCSVMVMWPETITHLVDDSSPLSDLLTDGGSESKFEVLVVLEGTDSATGRLVQVRTSYLSTEIRRRHCLAPLGVGVSCRCRRNVSLSSFHDTVGHPQTSVG